MKNNVLRFVRLLGRVLANAIVGGLIFAAVAAICLGIGGGVAGWFMGEFVNVKLIYTKFGIRAGVVTGIFSGVFGAVIFAIITFKSNMGRLLEPLQKSICRVAIGQVSGVISAGIAFTALGLFRNSQSDMGFHHEVRSDSFHILLVAFILMICGAIAGALSKRDWPKTATLNAE